MRTIKLTNKDLPKILNDKDKLVKEGRKISTEIEERQEKLGKIGAKVQKLKDKIIPIVQEEVKPLLEDFEDIVKIDMKDGEPFVDVTNVLDEFKKQWKEARKAKDEEKPDMKEAIVKK